MRKLIGKGTFSKAYQVSEDTVELVSTCPTKECYAMFSDGNPFAPAIERDYNQENTYRMPLYPKVRAPKRQLNERAYLVYKTLRNVDLVKGYQDFCAQINARSALTEEEKENIISLAGDVCNAVDCRDMCFEISPRNITHDGDGNLILLDCFFCLSALKEHRKLTIR